MKRFTKHKYNTSSHVHNFGLDNNVAQRKKKSIVPNRAIRVIDFIRDNTIAHDREKLYDHNTVNYNTITL